MTDIINEDCFPGIEIYSFDGKLVYSTNSQFEKLDYNAIQSNLDQLPPQLYIVRLYRCDGSIITMKAMGKKP